MVTSNSHTMLVQNQTQKLKMVDGQFNTMEASDLLGSMIEGSINFCKRQYLSMWERDHSISKKELDQKVEELQNQQNLLKSLIAQARENGCELRIKGNFEIEVV